MTKPRERTVTTRARVACALTGAAVLATFAAGCSNSTPKDAASLLQSAKSTLDSTSSAHFVLTSANATASGGTTITGGTGDIQRPNSLRGTLNLEVKGLGVNLQVVAVGDQVFAQLPFTTKFSKVDPSAFGLGNPGQLLDPNNGVSTLLSSAVGAKVTGQKRINGELVDEVTASVPGSKVPVLPDANPSTAVQLVASIDPDTKQLRQVTLTGPFVTARTLSTFTLTLTNYGENVQITLPAS